MEVFNVIESRKDGTKNVVFTGSFNDCNAWVNNNTFVHPDNDDFRVNVDLYDVDGDDYFVYTIEPCADDDDTKENADVFSFHEVLDMYGAIYEIRTLCDGIEDEDAANYIRTNLNGIYSIIRRHISDDMDTAVNAML